MSKKYFEVPKGSVYSEDEYPILSSLSIIPSDLNPSQVRPEPSKEIEIYPGENPFDIIEKSVKMGEGWVFVHEDVLKEARRIPDKFNCMTPHLGELFNFGSKVVYLNQVYGFGNWKVIWAWQGKDDKEFVRTPVEPEMIVTVVMSK